MSHIKCVCIRLKTKLSCILAMVPSSLILMTHHALINTLNKLITLQWCANNPQNVSAIEKNKGFTGFQTFRLCSVILGKIPGIFFESELFFCPL